MKISPEQVLKMPNAVLFVQKLNSALRTEEKKRRHFYEIFDKNKKMEFINGEIIYYSTVKFKHDSATNLLSDLLNTFVNQHNAGFVGIEKVISLTRNDYKPDICFFNTEKSKNFKSKQIQFPKPDFVVEVLSDSTERYDREIKFQDYEAHGIQEYWIIDAEKEVIEQYFLQDDEYEFFLKSNNGEINSVALPDFKVPIRSIFDEVENLSVLKKFLQVNL